MDKLDKFLGILISSRDSSRYFLKYLHCGRLASHLDKSQRAAPLYDIQHKVSFKNAANIEYMM